jgi:signal transduction histidine kinase
MTVHRLQRELPPDLARRRDPQIFEPFYTTTPEGVGTGLGLPISRRIVEAHGGTLAAESIPSRGTRMKLRLPLA